MVSPDGICGEGWRRVESVECFNRAQMFKILVKQLFKDVQRLFSLTILVPRVALE